MKNTIDRCQALDDNLKQCRCNGLAVIPYLGMTDIYMNKCPAVIALVCKKHLGVIGPAQPNRKYSFRKAK